MASAALKINNVFECNVSETKGYRTVDSESTDVLQ